MEEWLDSLDQTQTPMTTFRQRYLASFDRLDRRITAWMARWGVLLLRISLGLVFLWFGALKFIPGLSPAQDLATRTISVISLGLISPSTALFLLATWEVLIGLGLITGLFMRVTLLLLFGQMLGTMTPILFFPNEVFAVFPFAPTLEGQYIIKNLVLISAGIVIGATVRGGAIVADPILARRARDGKTGGAQSSREGEAAEVGER